MLLQELKIGMGEAIMLRAEPGFAEELAAEQVPWRKHIGSVKDAVLANGLDGKRPDQWTWMRRFEAMVGVDFLPENTGGLGLGSDDD